MLYTSLRLALIFTFAAIFMLPLSASAQTSTATAFDEPKAIAAWSLKQSELMIEIVSIFEDENFDRIYESLNSDAPMDEEDLMVLYRKWRDNSQSTLNSLEARIDNFPEPPELITLKQIRPGLLEQRGMLGDIYYDTKLAMSQTETYLRRAIAGDNAGLDQIRIIQIKSLKTLVQTETSGISTTAQSLPQNHPQVDLIRASIETNNFIDAGFDVKIRLLEGQSTLSGRRDIIERMEAINVRMYDNINKGRKAKKKMIKFFETYSKSAGNSAVKAQLLTAITLIHLYKPAFDTEEKMADFQAKLIKIYKRDEDFSTLEFEIDQYAGQQTLLFDERIQNERDRLNFVSEIQ